MTLQIQAEDFFNAYQVLNENNKVFYKSESLSGKQLNEIEALGKIFTGGVDIVCLAFSVELYIKVVHEAIKGKAPHGHDILKLFEDLPENIQKEIFTHHSIARRGWNFEEFKREIEAISDGFQKWRYSHESRSLTYNTYFALIFIEALKSVTGAIRNKR